MASRVAETLRDVRDERPAVGREESAPPLLSFEDATGGRATMDTRVTVR